MGAQTFLRINSLNSSFLTKYFPATCPAGTMGASSAYWCPNQTVKVGNYTYRCHLIGSRKPTSYGNLNNRYDGTIYATTTYQSASDTLESINLESLPQGTIFYKNDTSATQYGRLDGVVVGYTHNVSYGTGGKAATASGGSSISYNGDTYFVSGTRAYTPQHLKGYNFVSWTHDLGWVDGNVLKVDCSTGSLNATANFAKADYTCTIYDGIAGAKTTLGGMRYNETPSNITPPTKTGYVFNGIFGISNDSSMPPPPLPISNGNALWNAQGVAVREWPDAADLNFMSAWTAKTYSLNIYPNGGQWEDGYTPTNQPRTFNNPRLAYAAQSWDDLRNYKCTKANDRFLGFFTAQTGGVQVYDANGRFVIGEYWDGNGRLVYDGEDPIRLWAHYGSRHLVVLEAEVSAADASAGMSLPDDCAVTLSRPTGATSGNYYDDGTSFTATITTAPGWRPMAAQFLDANTSASHASQQLDGATSFDFGGVSFDYDLRVVVIFARIEYDISVGKHSSSIDVVSSVSAKIGDDSVVKAKYGDEVTFAATMSSGATFGGWYDAATGGNLVSAANPYTATISGSLALYARAKVSVTFSIDYPNDTAAADKTCSLSVGGQALIAAGDVGPEDVTVPLGDPIEYALTVGTRTDGGQQVPWGFDGWFSGGDVAPLPLTGTLVPSAADVAYAAKFVQDATKNVEVFVLVHTGTSTNEYLSESAAAALLAFTENVRAPVAGSSPHPILSSGSAVKKTVTGTQYINITAATSCTYNGGTYRFNSFAKVFEGIDTDLPDADEDVLSNNPSYTFLLNEDKSVAAGKAIYVFYGVPIPVRTTLARAGGEETWGSFEVVDVTSDAQGEIHDTDENTSIDADKLGATALQGKYLKVRAVANNGYRFVGWYWDARSMGAPDYEGAEAVVEVTGQTPLFAKFEQDRHSICEWEGAAANKVMEWRSKTYSAPQPFNPAGCRVDATGYRPDTSLVFSVEMFSSPDAEPTATATLDNIASQDARRLPIRRRERFMRVCVKSDAEVDGIFVATSMGGLAT